MGYSTRRNARHALRQIDGSDEYRVTHVSTESLERDLDILLDLWRVQWASRLAERYSAELPSGLVRTYRAMLRSAFTADVLFLSVLWQGARPIAAQSKLIDAKNRSLIGVIGSRDLTIKRPPPGFTLHLHSIRWAIENGFQTYDMQTGDFAYKYDFGVVERRVECLSIATANGENLRGLLEPRSFLLVLNWADAQRRRGAWADAESACRQVLEAAPTLKAAVDLLERIAADRDSPGRP
jgi:CelD/BcsL family acetyltransferase involved in cellulose biosynthesis